MRRATILLLGTGAGLGLERWTRRTRPTPAERRMALPGDALVPEPLWQATRATTIRASRGAVWPWLVQMGYPTHRAGWYIPNWIDRLIFGIRARSAERIIPELQSLAVGDRVPDSPDAETAYFRVAVLEERRALVLLSHTHPLPVYRDASFSWAFVLHDAGAGTRLVMRARITYTPVGPGLIVRPAVAAVFGIGDVVQAGAMLGGIRARAEGKMLA